MLNQFINWIRYFICKMSFSGRCERIKFLNWKVVGFKFFEIKMLKLIWKFYKFIYIFIFRYIFIYLDIFIYLL